MNIECRRVIIACVVALCTFVNSQSSVAEQASGDPLHDRIVSVGKLLNDSSVARQVESSDLEAATDLHQKARTKYAHAIALNEAGDVDAAASSLSEVVTLMYAAAGAAHKKDVATDKTDRDFRNRRASVDALLVAYQHISEEKGVEAQHEALRDDIAAGLGRADALAAAGETAEARIRLDHEYERVKIAIEGLRDGDTLVRELHFDSKEDEYLYELDRNETHKMLVSVLLADKLSDDRIKEKVLLLVSSAHELRINAELQAQDGHFEKAIETLEKSTKELVKAIRGAGVYIPG